MKENEFDPREPSPNAIIRANKRVRTLVIAVVIASALVGVLLLPALLAHSEQHISKQEPQAALRTLQIMVGVVFLSILPLSAYLFWFGYRAAKWRQIPPPGTWVIRNTRVVQGDRALQRGRIVMALAVLLFAFSLFCALYFPHRLGRAFQGRLSQPPAKAMEEPNTP